MSAPPRHHTPRSTRDTRGKHVAAIAKAKGRPLLPWQRDAVDVALEVDPATGLLWYDTVVVHVQRQAGKTKLIGDVADHRCLSKKRARVWFTQQTGKHASQWMREEHFGALEDAAGLFGTAGTTGCRYKLSRRGGAEGVEWKATRSLFTAFPPKADALHSKQSDLTFVDEAWAFDLEHGRELRQAIRPTMATRPGSQLWVVSAAGTDESAYLDEYLAQGKLALTDPTARTCIIDYGIPDDADPQDLATILKWHPAYGLTQTLESFLAAKEDFKDDPAGWARAYGTRPTRTRQSVWPEHVWTECGGAQVEKPDRFGLAFDVTPLGDHGAIGAGWRGVVPGRDDVVRPVVELLHAGPTDREFPALIGSLAQARSVPVDYDPRSPGALDVVDALGRAFPDVETRAVSTAQYAAGCSTISRAVFARELHHMTQQQLTDATENATTIPFLDGGFGWGRKKSSGSIAELVAVTIALRAFDTLPAPRRRAVAVGGIRRG